MRYIKDSKEVDLFVDSKPLTKEEKNRISQAILHFKKTGEKSIFVEKVKSKNTKLELA